MFRKKSKEKIRKMDLLITSVVLGTIIAGAFWLKKKEEPKPSLLKRIIRKIIWK